MPTLECVSRLLSVASALLGQAMPVEAAAGQDITESIRAALQDVHAIERRLFELHARSKAAGDNRLPTLVL